MHFDSKTFCSSAWFGLRVHQQGQMLPCYAIDPRKTQFQGQTDYNYEQHTVDQWANSDYAKYLREQLTNGQTLPECASCWAKEASTGSSVRTNFNGLITGDQTRAIENSWVSSYMRRKSSFDHDLLISADIKTTNTCNFACGMCEPSSSSQIQTQWRMNQTHPAVVYRLKQDPQVLTKFVNNSHQRSVMHTRLIELLAMKTKFLKVIGGEPLLDQRSLEILAQVPNSQKADITLLFCTNGSVDLTHTVQKILPGYKKIMFTVSLEGIGAVQDWARKGSNWPSIEQNIERYLEQIQQPLTVTYTQQAMTLAHYADLANWCAERSIKMEHQTVHDPDYFSLAAMPPLVRDLAMLNLQTIKPVFVKDIQQTEHRPELLEPLRVFLEFYDPSGQWQEIFPEWCRVLDSSQQG
jgi:MoaA/NifB/PqqE/SkfB family radical SAM enzyme